MLVLQPISAFVQALGRIKTCLLLKSFKVKAQFGFMSMLVIGSILTSNHMDGFTCSSQRRGKLFPGLYQLKINSLH